MKLKAPFFVVNPKSYLFGEDLLILAKKADEFASEYNVSVFFTAPHTELSALTSVCKNVIITAQHMDIGNDKNGMGKLTLPALKYHQVKAVVLNHADAPLQLNELGSLIREANKEDIYTIVCADSVQEAQALSILEPTIILAEPTELIGGTEISSDEYVVETIKAIKKVNPSILVEQGAGIRTEKDVKRLLYLGADGVGVTSGIVKADTPIETMKDMIRVVAAFKEEK